MSKAKKATAKPPQMNQIQGKIQYLGEDSFLLDYQGEKLLINPNLRRLYTASIIHKNQPEQFNRRDELKMRLSRPPVQEQAALLDRVDYILLSHYQYRHMELLRELLQRFQPFLLMAPEPLLPRLKNTKPPLTMHTDLLSYSSHEGVKFSHFAVQGIETHKQKGLWPLGPSPQGKGLSFRLQCGRLELFYAHQDGGFPTQATQFNTALVPLNAPEYHNKESLSKFIEQYEPNLVIPYRYSKKLFQDLADNGAQTQSAIHFPKLKEEISWN
jgi:hypothetical protein